MKSALLILGLLVTAAAPAHAQNDDRRTRAKILVTEGLRAQDEGRYDDAIARYQEAFRLLPHPEILFNLGQAYRLAGDDENALAYYRRYLAADPEGRVVADAKRWVAELEAAIDARRRARPRDRGRPFRIAGIASGGAGVVTIAIGIGFGVKARNISDDLSQQEVAWTEATLARQDQGRRAEKTMYVCAGLGAAAIVAGGVLYVVGMKKTEASLTIAPSVDGETVGLVAVGTF